MPKRHEKKLAASSRQRSHEGQCEVPEQKRKPSEPDPSSDCGSGKPDDEAAEHAGGGALPEWQPLFDPLVGGI
jgi:hypothetical protein